VITRLHYTLIPLIKILKSYPPDVDTVSSRLNIVGNIEVSGDGSMLQIIRKTFLISLAVFILGVYFRDTLPSPDKLDSRLKDDPIQKKTGKMPFDVTVDKISYHIHPLYSYELYGLVVSKHESDSFADLSHKLWKDHLNTADLCVIWGRNAFSGIYEKLKFSSGEWSCSIYSSSIEDWRRYSNEHLSNNHMLSNRRDINKTLRKVRVGDQIHFTGYLAKYSHGNFSRGTSTVRTDTGNGACETVYVEDISIIKSGPRHWLFIRRLALVTLLASIIAWFCAPDRYHVGS